MDGSAEAPMAPKGGGLGDRAPIPKPKKEHQVLSSYKNALKKGQKTNSHKVPYRHNWGWIKGNWAPVKGY